MLRAPPRPLCSRPRAPLALTARNAGVASPSTRAGGHAASLQPPRQPPAHWPAQRRRRAGQTLVARAGSSQAPQPSPVTARWLLNIKFGSRAEAAALLAEWIETVAAPAGLAPGSARLLAGAVGAPDGRLELELRLASLADLEGLWGRLHPPAHRAWGERLARHIEGSPRWEVFYELPTGVGGGAAAAPAAAAAAPAKPAPPALPLPPPAVGAAPLSAGGVAVLSAADVESILAWSDGAGAGGGLSQPLPPPPAGAGRGRARSGDVFIPAGGAHAPAAPPPASVGQRAADDTPFGRGDSTADDDEDAPLTLGPRPDGSRVVLDWKGDPMIIRPGDNLPGM